jgi:heptosyltransferase-3
MSYPIDPSKIRSILVIRFQRLGDLILVMTLVQNLRASLPQARLTLLCQDVYADFLRQQPGVDEVVAIPKGAGPIGQLAGWFGALRALITNSFDLVIDLSDNRRSSQLTRLTNAPLRIGFWPPARSPARRSFLEKGAYNLFAPVFSYDDEKHGHIVNQYLAPLKSLGLLVRHSRPTLTATKADRVAISDLLAEMRAGTGTYAVIHPGARTQNRRWPAKNYLSVIEHLCRRGISVAVIGDRNERSIANEIAAMSSGVKFTDLVGKLTLGQLAALLERCCLYIGNNTGPIHVAAGVGARIVAIYGIHSIIWAPLTERHLMVTPTRPCECFNPAICRPNDPDGSLCVQRNSVADVLRAVETQLSAAERSAALYV